jgi:hypothetical protein
MPPGLSSFLYGPAQGLTVPAGDFGLRRPTTAPSRRPTRRGHDTVAILLALMALVLKATGQLATAVPVGACLARLVHPDDFGKDKRST